MPHFLKYQRLGRRKKAKLPTLPDHLIFDRILPLLPVKSITRFKTACKTWLNTISTPDFTQSHLACSSSHPQLLVHGIKDGCWHKNTFFYLLPYCERAKSLEDVVRLDCNIPNIEDNIDMVGSCNGLVCLTDLRRHHNRGFFLWNPAISELWKIDSPSKTAITIVAWFGYVLSIDDYKIAVLLFDYNDDEDGCGDIYLYVYSLKVAEWKMISISVGQKDAMIHVSEPALIDDTLYWGDALYGWEQCHIFKSIIAFNLVTEQWKEFPRMTWLSGYEWEYTFAVGGCVSMLCWVSSRPDVCDVWRLKQQDDWNSWEKLSTLNVVSCYKWLLSVSEVPAIIKEAGERSQGVTKFSGPSKNVMFYFESLISPSSIASGSRQQALV